MKIIKREDRQICLTEIPQTLTVSTIHLFDENYETAIKSNEEEVYIMETYTNLNDAKKGHKKWVGLAKTDCWEKHIL